jgi:Phospholipase_D-nuclease N-terminal
MPFIGIDFFTILSTVFWVWMLVDCICNSRMRGGSKIGWLILIFFTHWIGALIYFFTTAEHKNPVEGLNYYMQRLSKVLQQGPQPPPPPGTPPGGYARYQEGYHAQTPAVRPEGGYAEPTTGYQAQPEYEQPTATYPEMPMQEQ